MNRKVEAMHILKVIVFAIAISFASCAFGQNACTSVVGLAVLRKFNIEHYNRLEVADHSASKGDLDREKRALACTRRWALKLADPQQRESYLCWLDYYAGDLREAYSELYSRKEEKEQGDYERKQAQEDKRVRDYEAKHPVPTPPNCDRNE